MYYSYHEPIMIAHDCCMFEIMNIPRQVKTFTSLFPVEVHEYYCDRRFLIPVASVVVILPVIWFKNISAFSYVSIKTHQFFEIIDFHLLFFLSVLICMIVSSLRFSQV